MKRLAIAKTLGFVVGLLGFILLPLIWADADLMLRWGILLWYTTLGGMLGIIGIMDHHPLWKNWKFSPWFRGIFFGTWLNFVLVFFTYEKIEMVMVQLDIASMTSPWWFVLEGAIVGLIIDLVATKYGGEGKSIM